MNIPGIHTRVIFLYFLYSVLGVCILTTCQRFEPEQLVIIKTGSVSEVLYDGCLVDGEIFDSGKDGISQHGFCWSESKNPVLGSGEHIQLGPRATTGLFSAEVDGLNPGTTYYIRAYAISNDETVYGDEKPFTTNGLDIPTVHTSDVMAITKESAESGGEVSSDGGSSVTVRGICWGTEENPSLNGNCTEDGEGMGSFSSSMTGLSCATLYYVRAYATNSQGTAYGHQLEFSTSECPEGLPVVSTKPITNIQEEGAEGGGEVSDEGTTSVSARGVCWSTNEHPGLSNDHTTNGAGAGGFSSTISGLSCGTTYFVRAYATNDSGTSYGQQLEFKTSDCPVSLPQVTTSAVTNILETSAQGGGSVTDDGGAMVSKKGLCWSTEELPDLMDNYTEAGGGTGSFISPMTGLSCGTTYYVRAYATNSEGTAYGDQIEFRTTNCQVDPPTVTTATITNITQTSAQGGGEVTSNGGAEVTARGICWGIAQNPSLTDFYSEEGGGTGSFTSVISDLDCGVIYYVRAYATNAGGTSYGSQEMFTTDLCTALPEVVTADITEIRDLSAIGGGEVINDGNLPVSARGLCWSTATNPEVTDRKTVDGEGPGTFTSLMEGLSPETEYFVRAYATNGEGTAYGEERVFTTWQGSLTDFDRNVYPTVTIGEQIWMQENLKVTHYADGTPVPPVAGMSAWDALDMDDKAYCWINSDIELGSTYGALYTWSAAMNGSVSSDLIPSGIQGVCPNGWHLPSDSEWKELELFLGMNPFEVEKTEGFRGTDEGGKLKEAGYGHWQSPNTGATNESGFTALPGGQRLRDGEWHQFEKGAWFWTSTENDPGWSAITRILDHVNAGIMFEENELDHGNSVRCVKDPF